jgi:hypothetical protein
MSAKFVGELTVATHDFFIGITIDFDKISSYKEIGDEKRRSCIGGCRKPWPLRRRHRRTRSGLLAEHGPTLFDLRDWP